MGLKVLVGSLSDAREHAVHDGRRCRRHDRREGVGGAPAVLAGEAGQTLDDLGDHELVGEFELGFGGEPLGFEDLVQPNTASHREVCGFLELFRRQRTVLQQFDAHVEHGIAVLGKNRAALVREDATTLSRTEKFQNARVRLMLDAPAQIHRRRFQEIALVGDGLLIDDLRRPRRRRRRWRKRSQRVEQPLQFERLHQVSLGAGLLQLIRLLRVAFEDTAHEHHAGLRRGCPDLLGDVKAGHFRQQAIKDGAVKRSAVERLHRGGAVADGGDVVALPAQRFGDRVSQAGIVFGEQDSHDCCSTLIEREHARSTMTTVAGVALRPPAPQRLLSRPR